MLEASWCSTVSKRLSVRPLAASGSMRTVIVESWQPRTNLPGSWPSTSGNARSNRYFCRDTDGLRPLDRLYPARLRAPVRGHGASFQNPRRVAENGTSSRKAPAGSTRSANPWAVADFRNLGLQLRRYGKPIYLAELEGIVWSEHCQRGFVVCTAARWGAQRRR